MCGELLLEFQVRTQFQLTKKGPSNFCNTNDLMNNKLWGLGENLFYF